MMMMILVPTSACMIDRCHQEERMVMILVMTLVLTTACMIDLSSRIDDDDDDFPYLDDVFNNSLPLLTVSLII